MFKLFSSIGQNDIGMGLYIANKIIDQFEGKVNVQEEGEGRTFGFTIRVGNQADQHRKELRLFNPQYPRRKNKLKISKEPHGIIELISNQSTENLLKSDSVR